MTIPDAENLATMARRRLKIELDERQAFAALSWWTTATKGLRFSDSWPGTIGVRAYHWVRGVSGADARGIAGAARVDDPRVDEMIRDLALHLDWLDPHGADRYQLPEGFHCPPSQCPYLTELDVNGQYLSAAGGVQLGHGTADLITAPRTLDAYRLMPGYVRLARYPTNLPDCLPYTWRAWERLRERSVITMNQAAFLLKRGVELDAAAVLIWPRHRQHLAGWTSVFRNARTYLVPYARSNLAARTALALVKEVANVTVGGWLRSEDKNHSDMMVRPWADAVTTEGGVRGLHWVEKAGHAGNPALGMRRDAAWFLGRRDLEPVGMPIDKSWWPTGKDGQLGKWKRTRSVPLTPALIETIGMGSPERVVRHLVAATKDPATVDSSGSGAA